MHEAMIRVFYPLKQGEIVLRTEQDWEKDMEPCHVDRERHCFSFRFRHHRLHLSYKPCIRENGRLTWARGANRLALLHRNWPQDIYPLFFSGSGGTITDVIELPSRCYGHPRLLRVYLPAGYGENTMKRYPVIFMHDGRNLFFPQEAFLGQDWHMGENLELLDAMNLTEQVIIVGIYADNREAEYTSPGYHRYGACIVEEIKPWLDRTFRTLTGPWHTGVMGSSLGGVVSFFLAWNWPDTFGTAACLSSTFTLQDDLIERVERDPVEPRLKLRLYIDSGWPEDNYDATVKMAGSLLNRGFRWGHHFIQLAFPLAGHSESAWSSRVHIPLQTFFGRIRRASMHYLNPDYRKAAGMVGAGEEVEI